MGITHAKVSAEPDDPDTSLVRPSDWNAAHVIAAGTITDTEVAAANKDGVAGTASMRTLGTGAQQAAAGNHAHTGVYQPADADLDALAAIATPGLAEFVSAGVWSSRAIGVGASTSIPTRADADTRYAAASHTHAESDVTSLVADLGLKAPLASPTFTGTPAAPTAAGGTNTTQIATTAFVQTELGSYKTLAANYESAVLQNPAFGGGSGVKNYGAEVCGAVYLGRLPQTLAAATVQMALRTTTAYVAGSGGTPYAEVAIGTGAINPQGNPSITPKFYADATTPLSAAAGVKLISITGVTLAAGVDLWALISWKLGASGGTGAVYRGASLVDDLASGMSASRASTQPSANLNSALTFTLDAFNVAPFLVKLFLP